MGSLNLVTIVLAAVVFFAIGVLWYGPLFGKTWRDLNGFGTEMVRVGVRPGARRRPHPIWLMIVLAFAFELLISLTLAHQYAMTGPSDRAKMMIAIGYGAMLIAPALGINYLFQMRPGKLFAIDAGYSVVGMAAMGGVHCLLG